ncbi:MAG: cupin [Alphaproteobacteria bacterium]|nr:cupin [Alphaproteobacteria bacterium]
MTGLVKVAAPDLLAEPDFGALDLDAGWSVPPGYPEGVGVKHLSGALHPSRRRGRRTTLTRWLPGTQVDHVLAHDYVEEVLVLAGELLWLGPDGRIAQRIGRHAYVCRAPGVLHGPFRTDIGFLSIEFCYYPEEGAPGD